MQALAAGQNHPCSGRPHSRSAEVDSPAEFLIASEKMKHSWIKLILAGLAAALFLNSCNTFRGMGTDVQRLGRGMQNTAERAGN
jgi:predicted small secreted protein